MKRFAAFVLCASCLSAPPAVSPQRVVERLGDADDAAADAAMIEFIRAGPEVAPALREALASCDEPRFRARAERALLLCAADAPAANGLKVGLRADRTELQPDEVVQLTTTVCNVTDQPIRLRVGCSNSSARALDSGAMLQRLDARGADQQAGCDFGGCGTGARSIFQVLQPRSWKDYTTFAEYLLEPDGQASAPRRRPRGTLAMSATVPRPEWTVDGHLRMNVAPMCLYVDPSVDEGKVRLRLHWEEDLELLQSMDEPPEHAWKGTLVSNVIELTLHDYRGR